MSKRAMGAGALNKYRVNVPGTVEELVWELYDFQTYAQAGQSSLTFFQTPLGQSSKTLSDTNMTLAGQIPSGQSFLVTGISFDFTTSLDPSVATVTNEYLNDIIDVSENGNWNLLIGSKQYAQNYPIGRAASVWGIGGAMSAVMSTVAATSQNNTYGKMESAPYSIIPVKLESNQNFSVTVNWPAVVALSVAGRLGCRLHGRMFRNAQ